MRLVRCQNRRIASTAYGRPRSSITSTAYVRTRPEKIRESLKPFYQKKQSNYAKDCDIISMLSYRYPTTGGGVHMEVITAFLVAVAAGVACHYIIKWIDSDRKDNK